MEIAHELSEYLTDLSFENLPEEAINSTNRGRCYLRCKKLLDGMVGIQ